VFVWGKFGDKQFAVPFRIKELEKKNIIKVKSGGFFYLALSSTGEIYGWGTCKNSRFGINSPDILEVPKLIPCKIKVN
jgi:alpha-tubulin suppressor-like RCC1 family protein